MTLLLKNGGWSPQATGWESPRPLTPIRRAALADLPLAVGGNQTQ